MAAPSFAFPPAPPSSLLSPSHTTPAQQRLKTDKKIAAAAPACAADPNGCRSWRLTIPLLLLSFFDGIATARFVLHTAGVFPTVSACWEDDEECMALSTAHFPDTIHLGSIENSSATAVHDLIEIWDPTGTSFILIAAGPPCPDFTPIKGTSAAGRTGPEGQKFDAMCDILDGVATLEYQRAAKAARPMQKFGILIENVVMNPSEAAHFSNRLSAFLAQLNLSLIHI